TQAGVAGSPRAPAGARWSRRHGFQGFAKSAHPWLSSCRSSGAVSTTVMPTGRYEDHSLELEDPLQSELDEAGVPRAQDLSERSTGRQAAPRVSEIDVVKQVEILVAELDPAPAF